MPGNHDFLYGHKFQQRTRITLIPDPSLLNIYGFRLLALHGDSLCIHDTKHQRSRALMHNRFMQRLIYCMPIAIRRRLANKFSHKEIDILSSKKKQQLITIPADLIHTICHDNHCDTMIHGHTHQPDIHPYQDGNKTYHRVVLGNWTPTSIWYTQLDDTGELSLHQCNNQWQMVYNQTIQLGSILDTTPLHSQTAL